MNFFGAAQQNKMPPAEQDMERTRQLAKESRSIDRDISKLKTAEKASMAECRKLIKQGYIPASKVLAKEVVNTRKAMNRMYAAQAQLNSVSMSLATSVGASQLLA
jgi:division protein CdvB (Snf7/Vps24/ESCRT-III family)